jgi:hypothetical protein
MTAAEALRLAHEAGISVSRVGDFIRYHSHGPPPAHVLDALKAAKPEIVALLSRFGLDASGALFGDALLDHLAKLGFRVRIYSDQAALDDDSGQGRVPPMPLLSRFAENQTEYGLVLRALRGPDAWSESTRERSRPEERFSTRRSGQPRSPEGTRCPNASTPQWSSKHES